MPKLPGVAQYGMGNAPQATLPPSPESIAGPVDRSAAIANQMANVPNPLLQTANSLTPQIQSWQQREQDKEDALARSLSRTSYFNAADQQFLTAQDDLTNKSSFDALQKSLSELKQNTIQNYTGSDNGRASLALQLEDYNNDYMRRAIVARTNAISEHFNNEVTSTTNRLAGKAQELPSMVGEMLNSADAYLADVAPGMSKEALDRNRMQMHNIISYSAIDGLLNRGDYEGAKEIADKIGKDVLTPNQRGSIDRRVMELQQHLAGGAGELKLGPDGLIFNSKTGQMAVPPPEVQQYLLGIKNAGRPDTSVVIKNAGEMEFAKEWDKTAVAFLNKPIAEADAAQTAASQAQAIDKLLQGVPTGTWAADIQNQLQTQFGFNKEQVASRQAGEAATGAFALTKSQEMKGNLSDKDVRFLMTLSPGIAQTALGRAQIIYTLQRAADNAKTIADAAAQIGDDVRNQIMTTGDARLALAEVRKHVLDESAKTFNPPTSLAQSAPGTGTAPVEPPGSTGTKRWKFENGQLVPE